MHQTRPVRLLVSQAFREDALSDDDFPDEQWRVALRRFGENRWIVRQINRRRLVAIYDDARANEEEPAVLARPFVEKDKGADFTTGTTDEVAEGAELIRWTANEHSGSDFLPA